MLTDMNNDRIARVRLYLDDKPEIVTPCNFYQNDVNGCTIKFELYKTMGKPYILTTETVVVCINKENGSSITDAVTVVDGSSCYYTFPNNAIDLTGKHTITLYVHSYGNQRVTFGTVKFKVTADLEPGQVANSTDYPILVQLIEEVKNLSGIDDIPDDLAKNGNKIQLTSKGKPIGTGIEITGGGTGDVEIVDNLTSTSKTSGLSANQGRILNEKLKNRVSVLEFGAKGDGVANDTTAIKNAIDYCNTNKIGKLVFPTGKYIVDEPLKIHFSNFEIDGQGSEIIWKNETKVTGNFGTGNRHRHYGMFSILGWVAYEQSITKVETFKGGTLDSYSKLTVNDGTVFSIGDYVRISCDITNNLTYEYKEGFDLVVKIINIVGNAIYIDYYSPFDFSKTNYSSYKIKKLNNIDNIHIHDFILNDIVAWKSPSNGADGPNLDKTVSGIGVYYGTNIKIKNITGYNNKLPLIMIQYGYGITSNNIHIDNPAYTGGGQGYGLHYCGVMNGLVQNVSGTKCRHVTDFSYSAFCTLKDMKPSSTYNKAFDLHGIWEHDILVSNINGSVQIGNGNSNFPMMNSNITIENSFINNVSIEGFINGLKFINSDINLYTSMFVGNDISLYNCNFNFTNLSLSECKYAKDKIETRLSFNNCTIKNINKATTNMLRIWNFSSVEFINSNIGNGNNSSRIVIDNFDYIKINSNLINSNISLYDTVNFNNSKYVDVYNSFIRLNNNIDISNKNNLNLFDFSNLKKSIININNINFINDNDKFTLSLNYGIFSSTILADSNISIYLKDNIFNNSVKNSIIKTNIINLYPSKNIEFLYNYNNKFINIIDNSNTLENKVLKRGTLNKWYKLATVLTNNVGNNSMIKLNVIEIGNSFSYKNCTVVLNNKLTSSTNRLQFRIDNDNVITENDIAAIETKTATSTKYDIYIKSISEGDIYKVNVLDHFVSDESFIELFGSNDWGDLPTGSIINPTIEKILSI